MRARSGFGDDAVVTADVATLIAWHCGRLSLGQAQRAGMRVAATPADERMLDVGAAEPVRGRRPSYAVSSARMLDAPHHGISSVPSFSNPAAGKA